MKLAPQPSGGDACRFCARSQSGSPADACRQGNDRGRSVSAWGFWGDILNSPYHCFGTACKDPALFRVSNQRFVHTTVDVAERNVEVIVWQQSICKELEL